jgi:CheY-like chemotaxis protein
MPDAGRILIADDDAEFLRVTSHYLSEEGYSCDCVADGASAETRLAQGIYDVLISDLEMPGNHELRLIRRAAEICPGLPVILATAYPTVETAAVSHELPVFAYLLKPVAITSLSMQVRKAVARYRIFKSLKESESRVWNWMHNLSELSGGMQTNSIDSLDLSLQTYLTVTFNNIIRSISELRTLLDVAYLGGNTASPCRILNCPLKLQFENAMEETISTLRDTKDTFKSKEIAALRKKLELLLAEERTQSK